MDEATAPEQQAGAGQDSSGEISRLDAFGRSLARKRTEAIQAREASGIEQQWLEDQEHFEGIDDANRNEFGNAWRTKPPGQYEARPKSTTRSTVFVNITRPYVNAAAARIADMLLPSDDRNFAILPTPVPDLVDLSKGKVPPAIMATAKQSVDQAGTNQIIQKAVEQAAQMMAESKAKADKAQLRIDDWMVECQYHAEVRMVIEDSARIGTGVLKGPVPQKKKTVAFKEGALMLEEKIQPGSKRIDAWDFFPDGACGENIHNGSYTWERDRYTDRQLLDLKGLPGYLPEQIDLCIKEGPQNAVTQEKKQPEYDGSGPASKPFEAWHFHGYATPEDLEAAGCNCEGKEATARIPCLVTMVNERVIKAVLNPLDSGEFPYDVFPWEQKSGSPWGTGVARQGRTAQRIVNAGARNMMDNGGLSSGCQIVLDQGAITPADGEWSITSRKIWYKGANSDLDDVRKAMTFFEIPSRQQELMAIVQFGLKMMEDATGLPLLLQGQQGKAPDTVGGMTMLNNNATAVLRRLARLYDDRVTEPHVRRYYTWLLQYGEDEEKGDFTIDARGSSALVERDIQSQELPQMFQLSLNPVVGWDPKKVADELAKSRKFDPKKFAYDDEKWQQIVENMAKGPQDPTMAIAQLRAQTEEKLQVLEQNWKTGENEKDRKMKVVIEMIDERLSTAELASEERRALEGMKTELAKTGMTLATQKELSVVGHAVNIHSKQVAKPAAEPAGRAQPGQAFQK